MAIVDSTTNEKSVPLAKGVLVLWNDEKGFGFVRPENGEEDHFVHISAFKRGMTRRPAIGDHVRFKPGEHDGKKRVSFAVIEGVGIEPPPSRAPMRLLAKRRSLGLSCLIGAPLALSAYVLWIKGNFVPFLSYTMFSVLTLMLYGLDKKNAALHRWRVPDSYFHVLDLLGGWPGALLAQNDFRHKLRKSMYQVILRSIVVIHFGLWAAYLTFLLRTGGL